MRRFVQRRKQDSRAFVANSTSDRCLLIEANPCDALHSVVEIAIQKLEFRRELIHRRGRLEQCTARAVEFRIACCDNVSEILIQIQRGGDSASLLVGDAREGNVEFGEWQAQSNELDELLERCGVGSNTFVSRKIDFGDLGLANEDFVDPPERIGVDLRFLGSSRALESVRNDWNCSEDVVAVGVVVVRQIRCRRRCQ